MLVYFMVIWFILLPFRTFLCHFVNFMVIWYIFPVLVSSTKKNLATQVQMRVLRLADVATRLPNLTPICGWKQLDQNKTKSEYWMLYFLCAHRSNASAEYNTWRNYLDRWNSKMSTTASLTTWNAWEQLNGYVPRKHKNQIKNLTIT
jgi:hypothetical protein